jgi:hypothetical protein
LRKVAAANDTDVDGDTLSVASVQAQWAAVSLQGGNVVFTPTAFGPASFTYIIDEQGGASSHGQPGGQPVNDAPVANAAL